MKKAYQSPRLIVHGDVEKVTAASGTSKHIDKLFPANSPFFFS